MASLELPAMKERERGMTRLEEIKNRLGRLVGYYPVGKVADTILDDLYWAVQEIERLQKSLADGINQDAVIFNELQAKNKQLRDALDMIREDEDGYCRVCSRGLWKGCQPECYIALALKED